MALWLLILFFSEYNTGYLNIPVNFNFIDIYTYSINKSENNYDLIGLDIFSNQDLNILVDINSDLKFEGICYKSYSRIDFPPLRVKTGFIIFNHTGPAEGYFTLIYYCAEYWIQVCVFSGIAVVIFVIAAIAFINTTDWRIFQYSPIGT